MIGLHTNATIDFCPPDYAGPSTTFTISRWTDENGQSQQRVFVDGKEVKLKRMTVCTHCGDYSYKRELNGITCAVCEHPLRWATPEEANS